MLHEKVSGGREVRGAELANKGGGVTQMGVYPIIYLRVRARQEKVGRVCSVS